VDLRPAARRHRLRNALVVAEISLSLVLLVGAGLLVKNFTALLNVNEKYHPESILAMNFSLPELRYKAQPSRVSFDEQVLHRFAALPTVQSAAMVTQVPYANGGGADIRAFSAEGHTPRGSRRSKQRDRPDCQPELFCVDADCSRRGAPTG